ncbi:MAG TPA: Maf family protein [Armatimonadota bacterium]|jgi:septum formation protein
MKRLILASASPRRLDLMRQAGLEFIVRPTDAEDEPGPFPEHAARYASALALAKAEAIASAETDAVVVGADTVVALDDHLLNKPADAADARRMLALLQGRTHQVITGVAVLVVEAGEIARRDVRHVSTDVTMREAAPEEIEAYIATGEPMDKAGAYGIQGRGALFIQGIVGDYNNVVGLPLFVLSQMLAAAGIPAFGVQAEVPLNAPSANESGVK